MNRRRAAEVMAEIPQSSADIACEGLEVVVPRLHFLEERAMSLEEENENLRQRLMQQQEQVDKQMSFNNSMRGAYDDLMKNGRPLKVPPLIPGHGQAGGAAMSSSTMNKIAQQHAQPPYDRDKFVASHADGVPGPAEWQWITDEAIRRVREADKSFAEEGLELVVKAVNMLEGRNATLHAENQQLRDDRESLRKENERLRGMNMRLQEQILKRLEEPKTS